MSSDLLWTVWLVHAQGSLWSGGLGLTWLLPSLCTPPRFSGHVFALCTKEQKMIQALRQGFTYGLHKPCMKHCSFWFRLSLFRCNEQKHRMVWVQRSSNLSLLPWTGAPSTRPVLLFGQDRTNFPALAMRAWNLEMWGYVQVVILYHLTSLWKGRRKTFPLLEEGEHGLREGQSMGSWRVCPTLVFTVHSLMNIFDINHPVFHILFPLELLLLLFIPLSQWCSQ